MATPPGVTAGLQGPEKEYIQKLADEVNQLGLVRREREAYITQSKGMSAGAQQIAAGIGLQIDAFNEQQKAAARSASAIEKMNAGVQKLPTQFLGVFTALQAGQDPVNTLLAQGLRMVETFGSVGAAAEGAGLFVASLANPIGIAAAAVGALAVAYLQGAAEAEAFNKTLILSGNAVGTSSDSLMDAARSIDALNFGITQSRAAEVINAIAASGGVGAESLERFAQSALTFERAGGGSADSVAKAFSSLAGDPLGSLESLNKSMNFLTLETYNQVKALTEQGRTIEAAKVAQDAYADAIDTRVPGLVQNLGLVEKAWQAIKGGAAEAWDSVVGIGRATTNKQKMDAAFDEIKTIQNLPSFFITDANRSAQLKEQWDIVNALEQEAIATARAAAEKKKQNDATKAGIELSKAASKYDTPAEQKRRGVLEATSRYETVLANPQLSAPEHKQAEADYLKIVTGITGGAEPKPKETGGRSSTVSFSQSQSQTQSQAAIQKKELEDLLKFRQLVADRRNKESEEIAAASRVEDAAAVKSIQSIEERITGLKSEELVLQRSRELNVSLAEAVEIVAIERLKEQQTKRIPGSDSWETIQKEIDKRQELLLVMGAKASREKGEENEKKAAAQSQDLAKKAQEQWKATADSINKSLTDAFMKSLESGKDFGKNLGNALKEQFKNLVLKPTINAILSPISGGLASAFGMASSSAGAAVQAVTGGGSSGLGTLASGASLLGSVGGAFSSGFSMTLAGGMGTALEGGLAMLGSSTGLSSALAGIGQIAGALGPIGLAIAALVAISKTTKGETRSGGQFGIAYGGSVTNQRRGQTYTYEGQQYDRDFSNGERKALVNGQAYRLEGDPVSDESTIKKAIAGTATSINDLLRMYGSRATLTSFSAGFETSGKSRGGVFAGGILSTGERFGESGQGDNYSQTLYELTSTNSPDYKTAVENFTTDLQQATLQALKAATDLPKYVSRQLKDVDIEALGATETTALLSKIGDLPNQLLQSFGTSRDALVQQFAQGLAGGDAAAAGETVANTLVASIEQTLFTTAAGRIFDTVNAGIIAPMLDAITTGANISEVLSQESIDRTIARAQEQAEAVTLLFNSPDFVAAMERIRTTVGGALGQAGSGVNYTPRYQQVTVAATQSTNELGNAASELGNAVNELVQQFNSAVSSLSSDAKSLQIDLLRAQGKRSEADALERDNYLKPFEKLGASDYATLATHYDANATTRRAIEVQNERNGLQSEINALTDTATESLTRQRDALDESNRALFDNVQAIKLQKTIADELPGVVDKYLSPAQRRQSQYDKVTADLNAVGIKVSADQLMGLSRAQIGSAAMDIYNTAGVPDEARLAVVRAAGALADLKNADVDTAFAALERAVDAQRKVLDEAITELTSVFETARDAAKTLFGEVESAVQFQGDEGRAFISNALAVAQSTGYLPESEKFSKAVSDATGALGQQMFATQAESDYQRLVLANELKGLQDISGDQLEKAKDELEYLDEQLAEQRKQIDVLNGIDLSVQSVAGAISALGTAMNGARSATTLGGSGLAAYDKELGVGRNAAGTLFQRDDIRQAASDALEAGANPRDIYNVIKGSGFTLAQAGVILGTEPGSLENFAREMDWPVFHRGTRRVPRTGFALLQQGEAVIPAAYNPFTAGRGWSNSNDMLAAMEGVRAELIEVRRQNDALQRAAMRTADAVNGRPEAPMLVENV